MSLDRRLNAYRPDLAEMRLKGQVEAARFVEGEDAVVTAPVADLLAAPRADAGLDTQFLLGDRIKVFDRAGGFAWVRAERDGYVGYVRDEEVSQATAEPTHMVVAPRSFVYAAADLKSPRRHVFSMGSAVAVTGHAETRGTQYAELAAGGFMIAAHLRPSDVHAPDFVTVAETLLETPYLWGGASAFGA